MKSSSILLLAGTLLVATGAALLVKVALKPAPAQTVVQQAAPAPVPEVPKQALLVLAQDIAPGEFIDTNSLEWREVEGEYPKALYFQRGAVTAESLLGATVHQPLKSGDLLRADHLVRPGEPGFIAAVIRPGMRAISVPTSAVASNSGLISTGDRVDVILSLDRAKEEAGNDSAGGLPPRLASQTLLHDVRVLALNNIAHGEMTLNDEAGNERGSNVRNFYDTATLEVTPQAAERLAVAKEVGMLHLVLLGAQEPGSADAYASGESTGVTSLTDTTGIYSIFGQPSKERPAAMLYRGDKVEVREFTN